MKLHKLGYLPIQIRAIPEGTLVPMGIPCIEITNTHPDFAWVVQWIECILQVELWKPCAHATIGHMYRELANDYYKMTCDDFLRPEMACSDFGMRGMSCIEEAVRCSSAWLLSFDKTSTIPAIDYIDTYYDACCWTERIGIGAVSTEHSCMTDDEWDRLVASGENPYKDVRPIKLMQKFIQKKGIDKVYACSKSPSSEIPGKKAFIKNNYDLPDDNIYFVANKNTKLIILEELQAKLHLKPSQIAIVEDTVKTLDYIRAHSDFVTVHVSSFME